MKKFSHLIRGVSGRQAKAFYRDLLNKEKDGMLYLLTINVGDVVNDCDGFNHKVAKIEHKWAPCRFYGVASKGTYLQTIDFYKEDGWAFCHVTPAWTSTEIQNYQKECFLLEQSQIKEQVANGWWTSRSDLLRKMLEDGELCCDENGGPSEKWKSILKMTLSS